MKALMKKVSVITVLGALLTSCGGGGSSDSSASPGPLVTPGTFATAGWSDCFELTPGVKFVKTNGYKQLIVQETFEGQTAFGNVELRADDTRFGAFYLTISDGYIHLLGIAQYDINGVYKGKDVYSSEAQLPLDTSVGQTIQLSYTDTQTSTYSTPTVTTVNQTEQFTFAGFEDLTLGGRTFANTCKITGPDKVGGQVDVTWFAKGFGVIRQQTQDAQGLTVPGTRIELMTIVSAP
jgi:hypothetical protein